MIVRPLRPDDTLAAGRLVREGMQERWGSAYDPAFNTDVDDLWATYVVERGADVRVAELDGQVVAVGALVPEGLGVGRLVRVATDAQHRRRGLGRTIIYALSDAARERGMHTAIVATDIPWIDAIALYEACGFVEHHRDDTDVHLSLML